MDLRSDWLERASAQMLSGLDSGHLGLIIFPTEQCNFRCRYCYEDFVRRRMSHRVVDGIKNLITQRSADMTSISIGWYGGEPLIARPVIREIADHVAAVRCCSDHSIRYDGFITTNGYLLSPDVAQDLFAHGITRAQVTLDGPHDLHDQTRVLANGRGTFDRIWRNLLGIARSSIPISILLRVHFHPGNLADLPEFISKINRTFGSDCRFHAFAHVIEDLGGHGSFKCGRNAYEATLQVKRELDRLIDDRLRIEPDIESCYVCYASKPNVFCIRSDGVVGKCTVALDDPKNAVGRIASDGRLQIDDRLHEFWTRGFVSLNAQQLACPRALHA